MGHAQQQQQVRVEIGREVMLDTVCNV